MKILGTAVTSIALVTALAQPAAAAAGSPIVSAWNGKCLTAGAIGQGENASVPYVSCGHQAQTFVFPRIRNGVQIKYRNKCLTSIPDLAWSDCLDGDGFTWRFHKRGSNRGWDYWEIKDRYARFCLDVQGFSRASTGHVILWSCNGGLNQLWRTRR